MLKKGGLASRIVQLCSHTCLLSNVVFGLCTAKSNMEAELSAFTDYRKGQTLLYLKYTYM